MLDYEDDIDLEDNAEESVDVVEENLSLNQPLPDSFFNGFVGDVRELAADYICRFFKGRQMFCGGSISPRILKSPEYITLVLNQDICGSVDRAFEILQACGKINCESDGEGVLSEDVRMIISIFEKCAVAGIPKCFAGGLMLMYLELCEGLEVCG